MSARLPTQIVRLDPPTYELEAGAGHCYHVTCSDHPHFGHFEATIELAMEVEVGHLIRFHGFEGGW